MNELTKKLLLAMGLTAAQIADLDSSESTLVVEDLAKGIRDNQMKLLQNDAEFIESIQKAEKGKNMDEFQRFIKKTFGLTADEIKDKKVDEIIKIAKDKASAGQNTTLEELQRENVDLKNKVTQLETEEIPKVRAEVDQHKKQFNINNALTTKIASLKLRNPIEVVMSQIEREFGDKYNIDLNADGSLKVTDKKNGLEVRNTDGTKILTADEILNETLSRNKFLEESGADNSGKHLDVKPDKKDEKKDDSQQTVYAPGLNKAEQHLKEMQEAKAKALANK